MTEQLTLLPGDFPVSLLASPASVKAKQMTVTSGLLCLISSKNIGRLGLLEKILLASSAWGLIDGLIVWKVWTTPAKRLIFSLAPLTYQPWNGTSGLLPRPTKSDQKGAGYKRFRTSPTYRGNFREAIREVETDGIYPNPEFAEWVKGFPIGWTELAQSETLLTQTSQK